MLHQLAMRGWVCVDGQLPAQSEGRLARSSGGLQAGALAWVHAHIAEYGGDPRFVAVAGGSAGGHLCALLALTQGEPEFQPGFEGEDTWRRRVRPLLRRLRHDGRPGGHGRDRPRLSPLPRAEDDEGLGRPTWRGLRPRLPRLVGARGGAADPGLPRGQRLAGAARGGPAVRRAASAAGRAHRWRTWSCPSAQHAFDVLDSVRCRHTTRGAVRFLEAVRPRVVR